ncbi:MAG: gamma carbonic anhydrase family protein [Acetobacteraceae bacterium]|nr:gamma carbonic anhydrase family protein [Acetobacteraceae bacterium]
MLHHPSGLLTLPFDGVEPRLATPPRFCGAESCVLGKTTLGADASIGGKVTIRADGHFIRIGDRFSIGDHSTVHIAHDIYPTTIGSDVTVGRNAVVHACTVGNDCVIEDDVVILDGSVVGDGVLIEANSIVFGKSELESGFVYAGFPAKKVRPLDNAERAERRARVQAAGTSVAAPGRQAPSAPAAEFIAVTASVTGRVEIGAAAGVYFSCDLDAGPNRIVIGENTNIQDNTTIRCANGDAIIGPNTTLGHNVHAGSCEIAERTLIGMGAVLAEGTVVEADVLVGACAHTKPGQRLETGWLWGGRPARAIARLDERKRALMERTIEQYCGYSRTFRELQLRAGADETASRSR